jgi:hypothetical protein
VSGAPTTVISQRAPRATNAAQGKARRDIRIFNDHEGGGEVVYRNGTHLHITLVDPKTREVWAEQVG